MNHQPTNQKNNQPPSELVRSHQEGIPHWTNRQVLFATLLVVGVSMTLWLIYNFRQVVFFLFIAIVLSSAIRPAVGWLKQRKIPQFLGIFIIYLVLFGFIGLIILEIFPILVNQTTEISLQIPRYYSNTLNILAGSQNWFLRRLGQNLPYSVYSFTPGSPEEGQAIDRVVQIFKIGQVATQSMMAMIAIFLLAFYWTLERERTIRNLSLFLPSRLRETFRDLFPEIETRLGSYIRAQFTLMMVVGLMALLAYLILDLPYALMLALIAGLFEIIPVFGPALGAVPAALIALTISPVKAIGVIAATLIIQAVENYFLVPRLITKSVGVNPLVTLLSLAAFVSLMGFPGALLAIPIAAIIQLLLDRFIFSQDLIAEKISTGRDQTDVLRYETQRLVQDVRKHLRDKTERTSNVTDQTEDSIERLAIDLDLLLSQFDGRTDKS